MCRPFIDVRGLDHAVLTAAVAALICMMPGSVDADENDSGDDDELTVRTTDGSELQRDDERFASALSTRVSTRDLTLRGRDLGDALSEVTGVYVQRSSSRGQPSHPTIRGGNSRQLSVHLDGLRLSSPVGPGFDAGTMMTEGFDSVDVYRGTTAVTHGGGAVTGAVQLNPATAEEDQLELMGRTRAGSFATWGGEAAAGVADDTAGVRLHAGVDQSRGDFDFVDEQGSTHRRLNNDHRRIDLGATGHVEGDDHQLRATAMFQSGDAGSAGPSEFQQAFGSARTEDHSGLVTSRWRGRNLIDEPDLVVDAHASAGAMQRDHRYRNDDSPLTGVSFDSRSTTRSVGASGGATALIGDGHLARMNLEARHEAHVGATDSGVTDSSLHASRQTVAATLSDEWLLADESVSLLGAVHAEYSTGQTDHLEPFLPAIGAVWRAHRRVELRANLARTFRAPHFDEMYLNTEHLRGNPDLQPERARTADAAVLIGADDDPLAVQAALFDHAIDSTILFVPVTAHLFEARSLQAATARGAELAARAEIAQRFQLRAGYTYTRARLDDEGTDAPQLPGQPRHRIAMESTLDVGDLPGVSGIKKLHILPSVHYRSGLNFDYYGHLGDDSALRIDLGATAGINEHVRVAVQAHNLLDDRSARDSLQRPLPGRAFFTAVEFTTER